MHFIFKLCYLKTVPKGYSIWDPERLAEWKQKRYQVSPKGATKNMYIFLKSEQS